MIRIANAPCSWGALEFDLEGESANYKQVLLEIAETGYVGTELGDWGFMPTEPAKLTDELAVYNLEMVGAFVPVDFSDRNAHEKGIKNALRVAGLLYKVAGDKALIVLADENGENLERTKSAGRIKTSQGLSDEKWQIFAEGVSKTAKAVKEKYGLRSVFHHHCGGFVETPEEIDKLMQLTNPELVGLCLDTGHYLFGGGDPIEAYNFYKDRIWHVHFKDCSVSAVKASQENKWDYFTSVEKGIFCELGKGNVDFKKIMNNLIKDNYNGWIVVEQDILPGMGDPKKYADLNRKFIKNLEK